MKPKAGKTSEADEAKVLALSHCILNRAVRWRQKEKPIRKDQGPVSQVLEFLLAQKIGAVQLPCPEFSFCGNPRPPRTKDEYENLPGFPLHCERLARDSAQHLKTLVATSKNPKITIFAVLGIERSPTCGIKCTPRTLDGKTKYVEEKGLFLDILEKELEDVGIRIPFVGVDLHMPTESFKRLNELLKLEI